MLAPREAASRSPLLMEANSEDVIPICRRNREMSCLRVPPIFQEADPRLDAHAYEYAVEPLQSVGCTWICPERQDSFEAAHPAGS